MLVVGMTSQKVSTVGVKGPSVNPSKGRSSIREKYRVCSLMS